MFSKTFTSVGASLLAMAFTPAALAQVQRGDLGTDSVGASWNYKPGDPSGPENWASIAATCATSASQPQSPLNIIVTNSTTPPIPADLVTVYSSTNATVENSHFTRSLTFGNAPTNTLTAGTTSASVTYNLIGIHAHSPSEHSVGTVASDAELHLVHKSASGQIAVVAILLTAVSKGGNADINKILALNSKSKSLAVNPANLLPAGFASNFYTYVGSLTTPPCTTGVAFYVLKTPQQVSKAAIEKLQSTVKSLSKAAKAPKGGYKFNNRVPLQNSEGRVPFSMPAN